MNQDKMDELIGIQREMLRWMKFTGVPQLKRTLETALTNDTDKRIYEMTDGDATTRSIAAAIGVGKTTVAQKWAKWAQFGIVERLASGQYRHLCSLSEVGIDITQSERAAAAPERDSVEVR